MDGSLPQQDDTWTVAGRQFRSRLIVGTGRYKDLEETGRAIAASGAEIVTVAVRRVNLSDPNAPMLQDYVDPKKYTYLPNTAGCFTAKEAVRTLRLAREGGGGADQGRVRGDGLLCRRPAGGEASAGHGLRSDHAAGRAYRFGAWAAEPGHDQPDAGADYRAVPGRCRRRDCI